MFKTKRAQFTLLILSLTLSLACEQADPKTTPVAGAELGGVDQGGVSAQAGQSAGAEGGAVEECTPNDEDYPGEAWPACISDEGRYELAGETTPSSAARAAAYEQIAERLWRNANPSPEDFIQAELIYAEMEGLQSRVARRYDSHVPKPEGADCSLEEAAAQWPEYCVGPALMDPLLGRAFLAGQRGEAPLENAKRVQAGLLWFLYVSAYKEANTCASKAKDCDSHWAYTNGAVQRGEEPLGFAGWAQRAQAQTFERLFDAHLAVRCWRDLDDALLSEDEALMSRAIDQLDRALDYALAQGLLAELKAYQGARAGAPKEALKAGLEVLGPVISAPLERRGGLSVTASKELWATLSDEQASRLSEELSATFGCP